MKEGTKVHIMKSLLTSFVWSLCESIYLQVFPHRLPLSLCLYEKLGKCFSVQTLHLVNKKSILLGASLSLTNMNNHFVSTVVLFCCYSGSDPRNVHNGVFVRFKIPKPINEGKYVILYVIFNKRTFSCSKLYCVSSVTTEFIVSMP